MQVGKTCSLADERNGRLHFDDYVSAIGGAVGIASEVAAVGIGTMKNRPAAR